MLIYFLLIIYIYILSIICFYKKTNNKNKKIFLFLAFLPLCLVMGLRDRDVGIDTNNYAQIFERYANMTFGQIVTSENVNSYFYAIYNKFLSLIVNDYRIEIFTNALIICILAGVFIYRVSNKHVVFSTLLFVVLCYYMYYFNANRQGIAILFLANAFYYLYKNNIKYYLILSLIAILVHTTAIISIIFIPLFFIKINKKNLIIIVIYLALLTIIFASWLLILNYFSDMFPHYKIYLAEDVYSMHGNNRRFIYIFIYFIYGLLLLWEYNKFYKKNANEEESRKILFLLIMDYFIVLCGVLYLQSWLIVRIEDFFDIYSIIFIPYSYEKLKKEPLLYFLTFMALIAGMYIRLSNGFSEVVPYKSWLL